MFKTIRNAWKLPELRRKLLFVIFALLIFRVGAAIPVPYINTEYLQDYIAANSGTIFGLLNTLSGSALSQATLFALSIQPYINASIIIQLLTIAIPALERLAKDGGEEGKKKIQSITRYTTLAIGLLQGFGYYTLIRSYGLLTNQGIWAAIVIVVSFTAGAVFLMWLGEQITEFGVGNGISIIPDSQHDHHAGYRRAQLGSQPGHFQLDRDAAGQHPHYEPRHCRASGGGDAAAHRLYRIHHQF